MTTCVGLQNPGGSISKFGIDTDGATTEADLISAVTVPSNDEHHLTDVTLSVAEGANDTRFRLYGRASSSDDWAQVDEWEINRHGVIVLNFGSSHKFKASEQWKVSVIQSSGARCSARIGGQAKGADARSF